MSVNIYDQNAHVLNIGLIPPNDPCAPYADVARAKDPETKDCPSVLGPNQPGINFFDPSAADPSVAQVRRRVDGQPSPGRGKTAPAHSLPYEESGPSDGQKPQRPSIDVPLPGLPSVELPKLPGLPDVKIGSGKGLPETGLRTASPAARDALLNYLFTK